MNHRSRPFCAYRQRSRWEVRVRGRRLGCCVSGSRRYKCREILASVDLVEDIPVNAITKAFDLVKIGQHGGWEVLRRHVALPIELLDLILDSVLHPAALIRYILQITSAGAYS